MFHDMHMEDVKAAIRKRHGTIQAFAEEVGVSIWSIRDLLRGRANSKAQKAIESLLMDASDNRDDRSAHPKNCAGKRIAA